VTAESLAAQIDANGEPRYSEAFVDEVEAIDASTPLSEVVTRSAANRHPLPVVDDQGQYLGSITRAAVLRMLDRSGEG